MELIDIDTIINDYELSYQSVNASIIDEFKRLSDTISKLYLQKIEKHKTLLKQISDVNDKVHKCHDKLRHVTEKIEHERRILQTENEQLESIEGECRLLEIEVNNFEDLTNKMEEQLSQVSKEKKEQMKKIKKSINVFKTAVDMYEQYLQLNLHIKFEEEIVLFNITMKNLKTHTNYNIIFEERNNNFKLKNIVPRSLSVNKAAKLYNQNKDIQGLLAFLYCHETNESCL